MLSFFLLVAFAQPSFALRGIGVSEGETQGDLAETLGGGLEEEVTKHSSGPGLETTVLEITLDSASEFEPPLQAQVPGEFEFDPAQADLEQPRGTDPRGAVPAGGSGGDGGSDDLVEAPVDARFVMVPPRDADGQTRVSDPSEMTAVMTPPSMTAAQGDTTTTFTGLGAEGVQGPSVGVQPLRVTNATAPAEAVVALVADPSDVSVTATVPAQTPGFGPGALALDDAVLQPENPQPTATITDPAGQLPLPTPTSTVNPQNDNFDFPDAITTPDTITTLIPDGTPGVVNGQPIAFAPTEIVSDGTVTATLPDATFVSTSIAVPGTEPLQAGSFSVDGNATPDAIVSSATNAADVSLLRQIDTRDIDQNLALLAIPGSLDALSQTAVVVDFSGLFVGLLEPRLEPTTLRATSPEGVFVAGQVRDRLLVLQGLQSLVVDTARQPIITLLVPSIGEQLVRDVLASPEFEGAANIAVQPVAGAGTSAQNFVSARTNAASIVSPAIGTTAFVTAVQDVLAQVDSATTSVSFFGPPQTEGVDRVLFVDGAQTLSLDALAYLIAASRATTLTQLVSVPDADAAALIENPSIVIPPTALGDAARGPQGAFEQPIAVTPLSGQNELSVGSPEATGAAASLGQSVDVSVTSEIASETPLPLFVLPLETALEDINALANQLEVGAGFASDGTDVNPVASIGLVSSLQTLSATSATSVIEVLVTLPVTAGVQTGNISEAGIFFGSTPGGASALESLPAATVGGATGDLVNPSPNNLQATPAFVGVSAPFSEGTNPANQNTSVAFAGSDVTTYGVTAPELTTEASTESFEVAVLADGTVAPDALGASGSALPDSALPVTPERTPPLDRRQLDVQPVGPGDILFPTAGTSAPGQALSQLDASSLGGVGHSGVQQRRAGEGQTLHSFTGPLDAQVQQVRDMMAQFQNIGQRQSEGAVIFVGQVGLAIGLTLLHSTSADADHVLSRHFVVESENQYRLLLALGVADAEIVFARGNIESTVDALKQDLLSQGIDDQHVVESLSPDLALVQQLVFEVALFLNITENENVVSATEAAEAILSWLPAA